MSNRSIDLSTLPGMIAAFALIITAMALGGKLAAFYNLPSVLIVVLGTTALTAACFSFSEIIKSLPVIMRTILFSPESADRAAIYLLELAEIARIKGILTLEQYVYEVDDPYLQDGLQMIVDNNTPEYIEKILLQKMVAKHELNESVISILKKAGEISPAMGLIGTLIGLVQMLGNLDDVSTIGPAMAVALLTTLYGSLMAYGIFFPLSSKLEMNSQDELLLHKIYMHSLVMINKKENPRQIETSINSLLPPNKRVNYFDDFGRE